MAGQKFEYDESGSTFYYFLLCFLGLVLAPASYVYFIKDEKKGESISLFSCSVLLYCVIVAVLFLCPHIYLFPMCQILTLELF